MSQTRVSGGAAQAPVQQPDETLVYTGKLYRGEREGEVRGWLFNHQTGFRVEFTGAKDPRGNGYLIVGKRVPV